MSIKAGGNGRFQVAVKAAKGISPSPINVYCALIFGGREKKSKVQSQVTDADFNQTFIFPVIAQSANLTVQLWDATDAAAPPKQIASLTVEVGVQTAKDSKSVPFSPGIGEIFLEWEYAYVPDGNVGDSSFGALEVEIVKAKALPVPEFQDTVSSCVAFQYGPVVSKTKMVKDNVNPFYNATYELEVFDQDDLCRFIVYDNTEQVLGLCQLEIDCSGEAKKGTEWVKLTGCAITMAADATPPPPTEGAESGTGGELCIRYKFTPRKRKATSAGAGGGKKVDEDDIDVGYVPKINGQVGLVPETRFYIWWMLIEDKPFRQRLVKSIMETFLKKEKGKPDAPYGSLDEVIELSWKCKTRLRLFNKLRTYAFVLLTTNGLSITPEDEQKMWHRCKEFSVMREEVCKAFKVEKALKSCYNFVMFGTENPDAERKQKVTEKRITKKTYPLYCSFFYRAILPELSVKLAKKIAGEDLNRFDAQNCEHPDDPFLFLKLVREFACFWCDTLTEFEFQSFVNLITPVLMRAHSE